ncbi:MAG: aromatic amino acid ammonia-lyase, partial [Leptospiraceae bacterium]|nr:aromatic amino acid ammonia-lyase [Leptospiraceae bacterium]
PLSLKGRDGLAIVNGTSASSGISALNIYELEKVFRICIFFSFLYAEIFQLSSEYYSKYFYEVKPHEGFFKIHKLLLNLLKASPRIKKEFFFESQDLHKLQPSYSLRASIQILGSVYDFLKNYYEMIEIELNSVSDNPLFFVNDKRVVHGANFYGSHLSLVNDGMRLLIHQLANLSERRITKLTDPSLNSILPKFLITNSEGVNSGFMGAQVTATAILSELRSLSIPVSIHSIPTNANNQDVIPMATTAARFTRESLKLFLNLLAIEGLVLAQAIEILEVSQFSNQAKEFWKWIRKISPFLKKDRALDKEIHILAKKYQEENLNWNLKFLF